MTPNRPGWTPSNASANLWLYRISSVAQSLDFTRGVFVIFLLHQGLSNAQIGVLQALLFWTMFVAEIPSGMFADHVRRKVSVLVGMALLGLTFVLFPLGHGFWWYCGVFGLWGLSFAFKSGAASALLYDGLKEAGPHWLARHINELGRLRALSTLCMAASMAAAGWFYEAAPALVFVLSAAFVLVAFCAMLAINESPRGNATSSPRQSVGSALYRFAGSERGKNMLTLICGLSLIEACHTPVFILSQSLLTEFGVSPTQLTLILSLNFAVTAAGMYLIPKLNITSLRWPVHLTSTCMALLIFLLHSCESLSGLVVLLVLYNLIPNMLFVYTDHYLQENADSQIRASWASIRSFITALSIGSSFVALGYLGDSHGMRNAILILPIVLVVAIVVASLHRWKRVVHASPHAA